MKKAGDYLAAIIDANLYNKAKTYSGFFSSWDQIIQGCGIAAAVGHSQVRDLEQGILVVETDHPGWIQILQTAARQILAAVQRRFPELNVRGVSFTLSKHRTGIPGETKAPPRIEKLPEQAPARKPEETDSRNKTGSWDQIRDPNLKDSLRRLERSLKKRERSDSSRSGEEK
jgi:hypothetical protein